MTAGRHLDLRLAGEAKSVTIGRHFIRDVLIEWGMPRLVDDAQLGTSELVANAVRHARTDLTLSIEESAGRVTISIQDGLAELRRPVVPESQLAESGRGLHIVAAVSEDWGVTAAPAGKVIWFTLAEPDRGTSDADFYSLDDRRGSRRTDNHPAGVDVDPRRRIESST